MDDLTREKIREWQLRRLEIKDRMQAHPEETLELSRVLDLMDEEHAQIVAASTHNPPEAVAALDHAAASEPSPRQVAGNFDLQLHVAAQSPEDLIKLLELATYELHKQIEANAAKPAGAEKVYPASMSGTLGDYQFALRVTDDE